MLDGRQREVVVEGRMFHFGPLLTMDVVGVAKERRVSKAVMKGPEHRESETCTIHGPPKRPSAFSLSTYQRGLVRSLVEMEQIGNRQGMDATCLVKIVTRFEQG